MQHYDIESVYELLSILYISIEEAERERLTERVGLGGSGHRWLWEADVPAELFRVAPANSEMVTEVRQANKLPQNGW